MTVQEALKELRAMFPKSPLSARHNSEGYVNYHDPDRFDSYARIVISDTAGGSAKSFRGLTLDDCMGQVRAWHKAQELNTVLPESKAKEQS